MILVPLLNPKFAIVFAARCARTSGSGHDVRELRVRGTSGPIPKFVSCCRTLVYELRNLRTTSNSMILVPLLNPKFAIAFAARWRELRVRGTIGSLAGPPRSRHKDRGPGARPDPPIIRQAQEGSGLNGKNQS